MGIQCSRKVSFDVNAYVDTAQNTALIKAVNKGDKEEVLYLLKRWADVNKPNGVHLAPLHVAIQNGHYHLIDYLIHHGANIEQIANGGYRPVHMISLSPRRTECLMRLVVYNADLNAMDDYGNTLLQIMLKWAHKDMGLISSLIYYGADPNLTDTEGNNCLHVLTSKNLDMDELDVRKATSEVLPKIIDVDVKNNLGETPLFLACEGNNEYLVRMLLDRDANILAECRDNLTPLDIAVREKSQGALQEMLWHIIDKEKSGEPVEAILLEKIESNEELRTLYESIKNGEIVLYE
ncbi:ankyrin-1-like [Coccinella septempunctata]|uniref:ankyrin-1-like n=1 Tax=Coccinella septempunctata TaxID=41139 RepID=UPI001D06EE89|nr:ankyrin-1-like [Coccinella septempunctata]